ncbi:MAG: arylsulfatase, partial [Pseudomonadota bacterium]
ETTGIKDAPVHVADLMPTLLDAAGVDYDSGALYGRSILPVLAGETDQTRGEDESFGVEVSGNAALYRGSWKLVRTALPRGDFTWRLFDLSVDPGETTDLAAENPELFAAMRAEYEAYSSETGVLDLAREDYAQAQLFGNLINRIIGKYWLHATGFVVAALLVLFLLFKLVLGLFRRSHA